MEIPNYIKQFVNKHIQFLNELYKSHYIVDNEDTHGIIYMKYNIDDSNIDVSYITFNDIIENKIIEKEIINNIKNNYSNKKIVYISNKDNNYLILL